MVIDNVKLRELVAKGPKYREHNKINWQSTKTIVSNTIDLYAEQWSKREQVDLKSHSEWKNQIKELVVEHISSLKEKILLLLTKSITRTENYRLFKPVKSNVSAEKSKHFNFYIKE